jgi:hypothetical protein
MEPEGARRRPSALVIVAFVLEVVLLVLFVPLLSFSELLQAEGPAGRTNAIALAITLMVVAIVLVLGSVLGYRRDRRAGVPIGAAIGAIALGTLLAIGHAGVMLPGALT